MSKQAFGTGKRKLAKARVVVREVKGEGRMRMNGEPLSKFSPYIQLMIQEPLLLSGKGDGLDISITVRGGGSLGQAEAARMAIARSILTLTNSEEVRSKFLEYDRNLLVEDFRRTEPHKPSQSSKGPRHKRQKSFR